MFRISCRRHTSRTKCASLAKHTSRSAQAEHLVQKTDKKDIFKSFLMDLNSRVPITPKACMESMQSIVWNPLQDGMESSRRKCTFGDAMRLRRYHTRLRVIPYQACGLNKKFDKSKLVEFFGRGAKTRTLDTQFWRLVFYRLNYTPIYFC